MFKVLLLTLLITLPACSIGGSKFSLDSGLDGCVSYTMEKLSVTGVFEAQNVKYHRVNEQCPTIPAHGGVSESQ